MLDAPLPSFLDEQRPGRFGALIGKLMALGYRLTGKHQYDRFRLERVLDTHILVLPSVANPKLLRTGAFFASVLDTTAIAVDAEVLDLGTGSGVCALVAARGARRVVAVDINVAAIRCAGINASMNQLEHCIDLRVGDLFEPVAEERFDLVLFNPPFIVGAPKNARDAAWCSSNAAERFAAGLANHLKPGGAALLLLSSFGNAGTLFEAELRTRGYGLEVFARKRYINETVTILRVTPQIGKHANP
ncbi:MAG: methyltransferase [Woeseiaceae bacterium]